MPVLRVLVVEDDADAAHALTLLLRHWGHKVRHAQDAATALARAREMRPDAALLDIGLPGTDGWEVAGLLRRTPGLEHVRLAALTGRSQAIDTKRSTATGFDRHFVKPADLKAIQAAIDGGAVGAQADERRTLL